MKYSNYLGILGCALTIFAAFLPWSYIGSGNLLITGLDTAGTNYGKPAYINLFMSSIAAVFFILPFAWAKKYNLFFAGFNLAWAIRNYLIITTCFAGECPEKKAGIYLLLAGAAFIIIAALLPAGKIKMPGKKKA